MTDVYRIACAAGFSGDRTDAARPLVDELLKYGGSKCLIFESLAERTLALAQLERSQNPELGFEPLLAEMLEPILLDCINSNIPIIGNFGAANPIGAAKLITTIAKQQGLSDIRIAIVTGDDISNESYRDKILQLLPPEDQQIISQRELISANVYLGAKEIADALDAGAQVVVTGRVSDPSLTVGPLMHYFQKDWQDWDFLGAATMAGHLLECGAQVTGGYFADPGVKDVPGLAKVGFPIVEFDAEGVICVTKPLDTGGLVNRMTVTEQLLYELHNPAMYLTPDVIADITHARIEDLGDDRVLVTGVCGRQKPLTLKANLCVNGGWLAEAEISYAGFNAFERAQLAAQILRERLSDLNIRIDFIGVNSIFTSDTGDGPGYTYASSPEDIRLRVAVAHDDRNQAIKVCREVTALYTCGPAGGAGVRTSLKPRLNTISCFIPRELIASTYVFFEG